MVNYQYAAKFNEDSLDKQISIVSDDQTINLTNADIVGESFELTETLCSSGNITYGATEPSGLKFKVRNSVPKMYKKWITVTINMQGATPFQLGVYRVWIEKPSADRSTRDITAYDVLYNIMQKTYKNWYLSLWENTDTMTLKQFRDAWFSRLAQTHAHITQESAVLVNDNIVLKKSKSITRPSGKDIFNAICEANAVFGHIGRDGVFHYIMLEKDTPTNISNTRLISADYEDFETVDVDRVEILDPDGNVINYYGETTASAQNTYTIESNFLIKFLAKDSDGVSKAGTMAQNLSLIMQKTKYTPMDVECKGHPCFEVGDYVKFTAHGYEIKSYVLERTLKGIQSLRDNYYAECGNGESFANNYDNSSNTYAGKIKQLEKQISEVAENQGGGGYIVAAYNAVSKVYYTLVGQDET